MVEFHSGWTRLAALAALPLLVAAAPAEPQRWVESWAAAQQIPEPHNALAPEAMQDATLRQIVHVSLGGGAIRVRVSNLFGTAPLRIAAAHVALPLAPDGAAIDPKTDRALTFAGKPDVVIPAGAEYLSDPVDLTVAPLGHVAVSLYLPAAPTQQTSHPGSRATSYYLHGDHSGDATLPGAASVAHWFQLASIEVPAPAQPGAQGGAQPGAIVAFGDSITDGHAAITDGDTRWSDFLAARLHADPATRGLGVLNMGIGGNRVLLDGLGPNGLARFDRDVLARPGVRAFILLEGVNDLGTLTREHPASPEAHRALVAAITGAYAQMVARARDHGIKAIGATILPYGGSDYYHPDAANEADRQAINAWIRTPGNFDGVVDFDAAMRDPAQPDRMRPAYDSGDHLHPGPAGYKAMADAIPLSLFAAPTAAPSAAAQPELAITFDDLPVHGPLPAGETRAGIVGSIAKTLKEAGLPPVYGFVNAASVAKDPALGAALDAWRAQGFPLGNHTWSHASLDTTPLDAYRDEIVRNEAILAAHAGKADWHWFRYPFLAEGKDPAKRAAIRKLLAQRGYRIAQVSMSFNDYEWNEPYARCVARGDTAAIAGLEASYLAAAGEAADSYRAAAQALYGHDIPYVLLMHVGAFDARMLPRLLGLYRDKGFRFVTLPEAERDPAYAPDVNPALAPRPASPEAKLAAAGKPVPPRHNYAAELAQTCL